jgi:hypothetical protein
MRVPGFDAGAFPTTGLGSLDSFIVRGFIDISTRGFPGFDVSASVLPGLASSRDQPCQRPSGLWADPCRGKNLTDIHGKNLHEKSGLVLLDRGCRNVFFVPFFVFPDKIRRNIRNFEDSDPWSFQ